jgi:translation initiation factor 5B
MTAGERKKENARLAKLKALEAQGIVIQPVSTSKPVYGNKKKNNNKEVFKPIKIEEVKVEINEKVIEKVVEVVEENEPADSWDDDDNDVFSLMLNNLDKSCVNDVEDELELEKTREFENLRLKGLRDLERERLAVEKREAEEREVAEMEKKLREAAVKKEQSRQRRLKRDADSRKARNANNLRSPISCIMGHVDTGKTKLLDKIRNTNVQEGEAGGITQQIGATQFSRETLQLKTQSLQATDPFEIRLPGLLVIDTPGHESFTNLRSRGSSLCDIAILVIDLMHGLEPQTIESIKMLKSKRTPFIVALNKVDRCYGWETMPDSPIRDALDAQSDNVKDEFKSRSAAAILELNEHGLNAKLYWENDDLRNTVSLVPTSAVTGEGVPDLLKMIITLTQERLTEQIMYMNVLQCTVLEVKVIEGLGTTVDVVLVNGTLKEGDTIVVSTMDGPVVSTIRGLLTPPPNKEMRVGKEYVHHKELSGAIGIKIVAADISRAIAGTPVVVCGPDDDIEDVKEDCMSDLTKVMKALETDAQGVTVHASTLGALEALLQFLRDECKPPIPVSHISIGPIYKKDIMRCNIMNEKGKPEFATILAFDTKIDNEAQIMADENHVRIFSAEIIYHLFDQFSAYMNGINNARKAEASAIAFFPCVLRILPQHIYNKKDPIVIGVEVVEGSLRLGCLLTIPGLDLDVGRVISIENNHRETPIAKKGMNVSIKIESGNSTLMYGRQFDHTNTLYSKMSRASIDALKLYFREELTNDDLKLIQFTMKKVFAIV